MRILEVGAGTGGMTRHVLGAFHDFERQTGQMCFTEYVYADISPAFFEVAREEFSMSQDRMVFKMLDVRQKPSDQGFDNAGFYLVVASSVLHATPDLTATLKNMRTQLVTVTALGHPNMPKLGHMERCDGASCYLAYTHNSANRTRENATTSLVAPSQPPLFLQGSLFKSPERTSWPQSQPILLIGHVHHPHLLDRVLSSDPVLRLTALDPIYKLLELVAI
jgi:SAM-dependent methyltransferase